LMDMQLKKVQNNISITADNITIQF
jgi:hypothetical protein